MRLKAFGVVLAAVASGACGTPVSGGGGGGGGAADAAADTSAGNPDTTATADTAASDGASAADTASLQDLSIADVASDASDAKAAGDLAAAGDGAVPSDGGDAQASDVVAPQPVAIDDLKALVSATLCGGLTKCPGGFGNLSFATLAGCKAFFDASQSNRLFPSR